VKECLKSNEKINLIQNRHICAKLLAKSERPTKYSSKQLSYFAVIPKIMRMH